MLLSVIVPVYNAGEYLRPCIESLLALPLEMEVVVVDDGSTDEAVERLAIRDTRLTIVHQSNQGVSAARNAGLQIAKGEWVWFVDADDKTIGPMAHESLRYETQHCCYETQRSCYENETLLVLPFIWEENGVVKQFEAQDGEIPYNLWRCWFRRELIEKNDVRFAVGRKYAEDQEFILRYLVKTNAEIKALDGPVYHYTMRSSGAMLKPGKRWKWRWDVWCVLWNFVGSSIATGMISKGWVRRQIRRLIKNLIII